MTCLYCGRVIELAPTVGGWKHSHTGREACDVSYATPSNNDTRAVTPGEPDPVVFGRHNAGGGS